MNNIDNIFSIIEKLQEYYAFGTPDIAHRYAGSNKIRQLTDTKIESIINGELVFKEWNKVLNALSASYPKHEVLDLSYVQFPSLIAMIEIINNDNIHLVFNRNIVIYISLLAKYYTIYYVDKIKPAVKIQDAPPSPSTYVRAVDSLPGGTALLKKINLIINQHIYVDPGTCFKTKIFGTLPYGIELEDYEVSDSGSYPLGLFLFGATEVFNNDVKIL